MPYAKREQLKPPIMQFGSISRMLLFRCRKLKKDIFFSPLLETHWTNGQQVHLHISPIGYNHTVCRLRESWNFNE